MSAPTPRDERTNAQQTRCLRCGRTVKGARDYCTRKCEADQARDDADSAAFERELQSQPPTPPSRRDGARETDAREAPMCPMAGCGVSVERPKRLFELGSDCPRHEVLWEFHATAPMRDTSATPAASGALPPVPVGRKQFAPTIPLTEIVERLRAAASGSKGRRPDYGIWLPSDQAGALYDALLAHDGATPEGGEARPYRSASVEAVRLAWEAWPARTKDTDPLPDAREMAIRLTNAASADPTNEVHKRMFGVWAEDAARCYARQASALATAEAALVAERERAAVWERIEREQWAVYPQVGGGWVIETDDGGGDVWELARTRGPLSMAFTMAVKERDRAALASSRAGTTGGAHGE